ncbi:MurR/RpiR family transcriptional regulator [Clostridium sp.]|uniref:MurR/RpiR family transcriptional regulator n=1 Tax=Clostridium sp. TaxID=1506 RepID=UPI0028478867|nr:MurR/RpiR family transcriptional regulator [Clostridium sp.]MDR3593891.1 MurR/RpiR family transcriptional regulator [Clostridium sp.]
MRLESLIKENYEKLNENDLYIWNYILHHKKECQTMSIQELASKCNISHTTILRFTRKLGLQGYGEMKFHLKWEDKQQNQLDNRGIEKSYKDIEKTMEMMKKRDFYDVFELLENADRIYVYGSGEVQKNAANDLKRSMIFGNKLLYALEEREETNVIMDVLSSKDIFFLLSLSGNNLFMNKFAHKLKQKGVKIISITQVGNNELASLSDVSLQFYTHPISVNENQMQIYSTVQFFLVNQILLLKYLEYKNS